MMSFLASPSAMSMHSAITTSSTCCALDASSTIHSTILLSNVECGMWTINIAHYAIIQHSTLNIQHSKWLSISPKCSVSSTVPINTAHSSTSMPGRAVRAKSSTTRDGSSIISTGVAVTSAFAILSRGATVCFARYHRCSSSASTTNKSTYEQK